MLGCSSDLYPEADQLSEFVETRQSDLDSLANTLESEDEIFSVLCVPPATIEVETQRGDLTELSSGDMYERYSSFCIELQPEGIEGWVSKTTETLLLYMPIVDENRFFRVDFVRAMSEELDGAECDLLEYAKSASVCEVRVNPIWSIRYTWNDENDPASLYEEL